MRIDSFAVGFAAACLAAAQPLSAARHRFTYTILNVPGQPYTFLPGLPGELNDHDEVVGGIRTATFNYLGFLFDHGKYTLYPGSNILGLVGINDRGLAVGGQYDSGFGSGYMTVDTKTGVINNYMLGGPFNGAPIAINLSGIAIGEQRPDDTMQGFILRGDHGTKFLVPGSNIKYGGTYPSSINDTGTVVGSYTDKTGSHGFFRQGDAYTSFDVPGGTTPSPNFLTSDATTGGSYLYDNSTKEAGFVRHRNHTTIINPPGATLSAVSAMGPSGELAGTVYNDGTIIHGFIYRDHVYHRIVVPGSTATYIDSVNARGSLTGKYIDSAGQTHFFLARCPAGDVCEE
jgi:hypothetical protein